MGIPAPPDVLVRLPAAMSEPYVMQWYPTDGGYASLAVHAFDPLAGTLDGINSAGLVVSILADEEALAMLGPLLEPHFGARGAVGLHELQMMRWLLDTCDSADQARDRRIDHSPTFRIASAATVSDLRNARSFHAGFLCVLARQDRTPLSAAVGRKGVCPGDGAGASWLYRNVEVLEKSMTEGGRLCMTVRVDPAKVGRVRAKFESGIKANLP